MAEWGMAEQSPRIQRIVRRVLNELHPEALLILKDARLEVMVLPEAEYSAWVYFPVSVSRFLAYKSKMREQWKPRLSRGGTCISHNSPIEYSPDRDRPKMDGEYVNAHAQCAVFWRRLISNELCPKQATRALLVMSTAGFAKESPEALEDYLRQDLGHVLLFLRSRTARNEYGDALKEWKYWTVTAFSGSTRVQMPALQKRRTRMEVWWGVSGSESSITPAGPAYHPCHSPNT